MSKEAKLSKSHKTCACALRSLPVVFLTNLYCLYLLVFTLFRYGYRGKSHLRAILWCHGCGLSNGFYGHGSCIRYGQVRYGHRRDVRDEARAHHEVHHPGGDGWYSGHLRAGGGRPHRRQHQRAQRLPAIPRIPALWRGTIGGPERIGGWVRNRYRR